jgi:hypothetical protein
MPAPAELLLLQDGNGKLDYGEFVRMLTNM